MNGYLPKQSSNSNLNKTILRTLWNNNLISKSLRVKNENEAREWFTKYPEVHDYFEILNKELERKMKELQDKAKNYIQYIMTQHRNLNKRSQKTSLKSTKSVKKPKLH